MKKRPLLSTLAAGVALASGVHGAVASELPSVVIVHGAFADGSDWAKVIALLKARGVQVTAVQNGLESLASDVATTRRIIDNQQGKVVLVEFMKTDCPHCAAFSTVLNNLKDRKSVV